MVISLPLGTRLIISSTSLGAGITMVPVPHLLLILSVISTTLGKSLSSASFSCQVLRALDIEPHPLNPSLLTKERGEMLYNGDFAPLKLPWFLISSGLVILPAIALAAATAGLAR